MSFRQTITQAKLACIVAINKLDHTEWTDADVNIQYEISQDPDILALMHAGVQVIHTPQKPQVEPCEADCAAVGY